MVATPISTEFTVTSNKPEQISAVTLPSCEQFPLLNDRGEEYLIQISWPISWENRTGGGDPVPILYMTDGNAMFLTATEAGWRRAFDPHFAGGGIIVAIGYPLTDAIFDVERRRMDFTFSTKDNKAEYGGGNRFVDFVVKQVRPAVRERFQGLSISREALYGHSLGGLLVLHSLFNCNPAFDCYIASSPSIWFEDRSILEAAKRFQGQSEQPNQKLPVLMLSVGSSEQYPPRWAGESIPKYETRKRRWDEVKMAGNASELFELLKASSKLRATTFKVFEGEEHTSVMACSINRALTEFFEDWQAFARK